MGSNVNVKTCTLHIKPTTQYIPDYWAVRDCEWIWYCYTWSKVEDLVSLIERLLKNLNINSIELNEVINQLKSYYKLEIEKYLKYGNIIDYVIKILEKLKIVKVERKDNEIILRKIT